MIQGNIDDLINFHGENYELLSFVTGVNCITSIENIDDVNKKQDYGHYISFANINNDFWIKVDMLGNPNSKIIKIEDIPDLTPCKEGKCVNILEYLKKDWILIS